jgi:hypothetical protein
MTNPSDLVTVFRSADYSAADDAAAVVDVLTDAGLNPAMFNDQAPGVPVGAYEVRVPAAEEAEAERALAEAWSTQERVEGDPSHGLDLVAIYEGVGAHAEMEAFSIRAVLDAYNIPSVLVGASQYPNLPFVVRVPMTLERAARAAVAEAEQSGPEAADQAAGTQG